MSYTQREKDEGLVEEITDLAELLEREPAHEFAGSLALWLEGHDTLTERQRDKAVEILDELTEAKAQS